MLRSRLLNRSACVIAFLLAVACTDASGPGGRPPSPSVQLITLQTFDGSGQAVHPDPAITPLSWDGIVSQLAVTPYPNGDATKENPSLYSGRSWREWVVPEGVMNPIATPASGYLSDPDQLYDPESSQLWLYYRAVNSENEIFLIRAAAPTRRSDPVRVLAGPNHTIVSPSIVRRSAHDWMMWSVNSGTLGCSSASTTVEVRRSMDGVNWSEPAQTDLADKDSYPWHIDVEWIADRSEFWAVYNVKEAGSCTTPALHFATSTDGVTWTAAPSPALARGAIPAFADIVYRGATYYDPATRILTLWYSGARFENGRYIWRIAAERIPLDNFLARVASTANTGAISVTTAPPLTNDDAP